MSLLSYQHLVRLVGRGVITNCPIEFVNSASIDVTLADKIMVEDHLKALSYSRDIPISVATCKGSYVLGSACGRCPRCEAEKKDFIVDFRARQPLPMTERTMNKEEGYILMPGEFILAATEQLFNLPNDIAMEVKLKSSAARVAIEHLGAGWADPTWHGSALTMEICNCCCTHAIRLRPGDRIAQVTFFACDPVPEHAAYKNRGRYNNTPEVTAIKP